jgi:hypothetical protein
MRQLHFIAKKLNTKVIRAVSRNMEEQQIQLAPESIRSTVNSSWWLFCLAVLTLNSRKSFCVSFSRFAQGRTR